MTPTTFQLRRNATKGSAVILAALNLAGSLAVVPAPAQTNFNEQAYAQELTNQIAALGVREAALGEQYDAGVAALQQANARVAAAAKALASAKANQRKTVVLLRQDAVQAYVGGGPALELAGPVALTNVNQALAAPGARTDLRFARVGRPGQLPVRRRRGEHGSGWVSPGQERRPPAPSELGK